MHECLMVAGLLRDGWIGVDGIVVSAQAVNEREQRIKAKFVSISDKSLRDAMESEAANKEPLIDVSKYRDAAIENFEAEVQAFLEKHKEDWLIIESYQEYYPTAQQAEFGRPYELLDPADSYQL